MGRHIYKSRVYGRILRDSRMDREDQLKDMDDWNEFVHRELREKIEAVKVARQELDDYEAWLISRDDFRRKLIESLK